MALATPAMLRCAEPDSKEPGSAAGAEYRALLSSQPEHPSGMQLWPLLRRAYTAGLPTGNAVR